MAVVIVDMKEDVERDLRSRRERVASDLLDRRTSRRRGSWAWSFWRSNFSLNTTKQGSSRNGIAAK
jgi:hypothetical protein